MHIFGYVTDGFQSLNQCGIECASFPGRSGCLRS